MQEIDKTKLTDQTKFRLYEIKKVENCLITNINQQKVYSKKLGRYVTIFDYINKIFIVLSATTSGASIISVTNTIDKSVGIVSARFTLIFSHDHLLMLLQHDHLLMLAKSKFNSVKTLISQALSDLDISHEEFIIIFI